MLIDYLKLRDLYLVKVKMVTITKIGKRNMLAQGEFMRSADTEVIGGKISVTISRDSLIGNSYIIGNHVMLLDSNKVKARVVATAQFSEAEFLPYTIWQAGSDKKDYNGISLHGDVIIVEEHDVWIGYGTPVVMGDYWIGAGIILTRALSLPAISNLIHNICRSVAVKLKDRFGRPGTPKGCKTIVQP